MPSADGIVIKHFICVNRELAKFSKELDRFNSLPSVQRERLITKVLVNNNGALMAFEENLDVIKELDEFQIDPNEVLKMAKSCRTHDV